MKEEIYYGCGGENPCRHGVNILEHSKTCVGECFERKLCCVRGHRGMAQGTPEAGPGASFWLTDECKEGGHKDCRTWDCPCKCHYAQVQSM